MSDKKDYEKENKNLDLTIVGSENTEGIIDIEVYSDIGNFTILPNEIEQNKNLSLRAKCLLWHILSKPRTWVFYDSVICGHLGCSINSLDNAFSELRHEGYSKTVPGPRNKNGQVIGTKRLFSNRPIFKSDGTKLSLVKKTTDIPKNGISVDNSTDIPKNGMSVKMSEAAQNAGLADIPKNRALGFLGCNSNINIINNTNLEITTTNVVSFLTNLGFSVGDASKLLQEYGEQLIRDTMTMEKFKGARNQRGWLVDALKGRWFEKQPVPKPKSANPDIDATKALLVQAEKRQQEADEARRKGTPQKHLLKLKKNIQPETPKGTDEN